MIKIQKEFLAPGIVFLPSAVPHSLCASIIDSIESMKSWIPARTGVYEGGNLIDIDVYGATRGVKVAEWKDTKSEWFEELSSLIRKLASETWGIPITGFSRTAVSKYEDSPGIDNHADSGVYNTNRILTIVLYLNEDFEGGKLLFPKQAVELSPHQGDIVVFFSEYVHSVTPILHGRRYAMIFFGENSDVTNYNLKLI